MTEQNKNNKPNTTQGKTTQSKPTQGRNNQGRNGNKRNNNRNRRPRVDQVKEYEERVLDIRRVSKKTKGGNNVNFTALVVIGNRKGTVATGYAKAPNVPDAIKKAIKRANASLIKINLTGDSISHSVTAKEGAAKVLLKPAPEGTGIIAGGAVRTVVELAGVKNVSSKMLGANNKISNVRCTLKALQMLKKESK